MKRQTFPCLWFLLTALLWPSLFSANPIPSPAKLVPESTCPAPPPAWITTTNITPTSISLLWEANMASVYYKVEGVDLSSTAVLPTYYTQLNNLTYSGLTPGHLYRFGISVSYCLSGPYGQTEFFEEYTIIIDLIVGLQDPCRVEDDRPTGNGTSYVFCVKQSDDQDAPYTNGFVGQLYYNNTELNFGIAAVGTNVHVGELQASPFSFHAINNNSAAVCKYGTTELFTIGDLGMPNSFSNISLRITFNGNYGDFAYCGNGCPLERPTEGNDDATIGMQNEVSIERAPDDKVVLAQLSPNPFSESATFRYELKEAGPVEANLFDATGRLVKVVEKTTQQEPGQYERTIDGAGLPHGVYFLHLTTAQNREVFPLVKRE